MRKLNAMLYLFALLTVALPAQAASFDCAKASTKIEHLICDNPEISKLDEAMAESYKEALKDHAHAKAIRQAQREWIKERNHCDDAACVQHIFETRLSALRGISVAVSAPGQKEDQSKYLMIHGKGQAICEHVFKQMNEGPPLCALDLLAAIPGVVLPKWKKLDWQVNKLLYERFLVAQMVREEYYPQLFGKPGNEADAIPIPTKEQLAKGWKFVFWGSSNAQITVERLEQEWKAAIKYGNEFYRWDGAVPALNETDVILVETTIHRNLGGCPTVRMVRFSAGLRTPKPWFTHNSGWFIPPGQYPFKFDNQYYSLYEESGLSKDSEGMLTVPFRTLTIDAIRKGHYCFIQTNYSYKPR